MRPWARSNGNYTARVTHYAAPKVALCRQSDAVDHRSRHHEGGVMQPEGGIMSHSGSIISVIGRNRNQTCSGLDKGSEKRNIPFILDRTKGLTC